MQVIMKPRGMGKTHDLIRLSAETQIPIVAVNTMYIRDEASRFGYNIPVPIEANDLKNTKVDKVYIDDMDCIMKFLLGCDVDVCTMTC